jgi:hypothetical protein
MTKKILLIGSTALLAIVSLALVAEKAPAQQPAGKGAAPSPARAFANQYCVGCHSQAAKTAANPVVREAARHFTMDDQDIDDVSKNPELWERVVRKVRAGMMPPTGLPRPDAARFEAWISGLETALDTSAAKHLPPPGIHRLNRNEYANVIYDLLGLKINPAQYLPSDDSTRGFDNIAGGLNMSPALLEGYVTAASKISRAAMGNINTAVQVTYRVPEDTSQDYHIEGMPFGTRGGMIVEHEFPADGMYNIKITPISKGNMGNTNPFGEIPGERLQVLLDGELIHMFNWDNNQERRGGVFTTPEFPVKAGRHTVVVTFVATNDAPGTDLNRHFLRSSLETGGLPGFRFFPHVGKFVIDGPYNAKGASDTEARKKIFVCTPASASQETACAREIVNNLARRAYRRPVTERDTELLLGFYQQGRNKGTFDDGIEMALRRILSDPEFIFRRELEPADVPAGGIYRISDLELASRLSFFLWSTIPDDELLKVASQNRLREPGVLEQQVRRMLKDPRAQSLVDNFAGQWLSIRAISSQVPVANLFPDFDDNLRYALRKEMELFVGYFIQEDRPITEMLDANYTFVNERLAIHYGIPNVYGSFFRRVELPPELDMRRGLLGKGLLMMISSQPGRTSPVQRGKTVMQTFLGVEPPAPPPNVEINLQVASAGKAVPTMRQQMELHRTVEPCKSCHAIMDPIGFSLENFDAVGAWRYTEFDQPIDPSGKLVDGTTLNGVKDLRDALIRYSPQFVRVAVEKMLIYALGRGTEHYDMPLVRQIVKDAAKDNYRFSSLVLGVVKSDPFQMNQKLESENTQQRRAE